MTHFANIHKYSSNWKLSTPYSHSGNCWVMEVDWDVRAWLLNLLYFWNHLPAGLVNPSYLISLHSLPLLLLCRELSFKGFDEEMEVSYFTGTVALCVLGCWVTYPSPLYRAPPPWTAWVAVLKVILEFILNWKLYYHFLGWANAQLHFSTVAETWKQIRKGKNSSKAGHFIFLQKGTKAKGQWEERK